MNKNDTNMKIQFASDLHLEFAENRSFIEDGGIVPVGEVLVLAGDVSYLGDKNMLKRRFFDWCAEHFLSDADIEARPLWKPMHRQPVYLRGSVETENRDGYSVVTSESSVAYVNGVSESLFKVGMCLPSGPCVTDDDVRYIVDSIKRAIL